MYRKIKREFVVQVFKMLSKTFTSCSYTQATCNKHVYGAPSAMKNQNLQLVFKTIEYRNYFARALKRGRN